MMLDMWFIFL